MNQNIIIQESASQLRAMAREVLRGKWKEIIIGALIYTILSTGIKGLFDLIPVFNYSYTEPTLGISYNFSGISNLYTLLTTGPLSLGFAAYLLTFMRSRNEDKSLLLYGFQHFLQAMVLGLLISIFAGLWTMLFVIPGIIALYKYSQSFYIKFDNPNMDPMDCIRLSKFMTNGNKGTIFITELSFIGWWILATLLSYAFDSNVVTGVITLSPVVNWIISYILALPQVAVVAYSETTNVVMYEIMSGHLYRAMPQGPGYNNPGFSQNGYGDPNRDYGGPTQGF